MTIFDNIQDNINPGDDFYKFATGKWLANNPQPDEYPRWCNFTKLDDDNIKRINDIILNPDDSVLSKKLNTLYNILLFLRYKIFLNIY
jgi:putative endopeptidase